MRKYLSGLCVLLLIASAMAQYVSVARNKGAATASTYTFVGYSYYSEDSTSRSSITVGNNTGHSGPALTASSGDIFIFFVRNTDAGSAGTFTCSPSCTSHVFNTNNALGTEMAWLAAGGAGLTTFTYTPGASETFMAGIVLQYHYSGGGATQDTHLENNTCGSGATCTTGTFTTTAQGLVVMCTSQPDSGITYTAASIGGNSSTLRGFSDTANAGAGVDSACEDTTFSGGQSSITAAMTSDSLTSWTYQVGALK